MHRPGLRCHRTPRSRGPELQATGPSASPGLCPSVTRRSVGARHTPALAPKVTQRNRLCDRQPGTKQREGRSGTWVCGQWTTTSGRKTMENRGEGAVVLGRRWELGISHPKPPPVPGSVLCQVLQGPARAGKVTRQGGPDAGGGRCGRPNAEWVGQGLEQLRPLRAERPHASHARALRGCTPRDWLPVRGGEERGSAKPGAAWRAQHRVFCRVRPSGQEIPESGLKLPRGHLPRAAAQTVVS